MKDLDGACLLRGAAGLDLDIGLDPTAVYVPAARGQIRSGRQLEGRRIRKRNDLLNRTFAIGRSSHDDSAVSILKCPGNYLRGTRRAFVDEHNDRNILESVTFGFIRNVVRLLLTIDDYLPALDED